ncbi:MutS-related protein [Chitinophaga sp. 22620]|uniref:MutS-related protein n=1 Tax=Chitinophaga sp. 22620 TaxID=3453952 RepID=UPI003F84C29C
MLFTTDKQTLEDLNIFGKHGGDSVYNIFNRCATRGGAAILEEMFRYPLSDDPAINRRCGIIRHFAEAGTPFPFQGALFDAAEPYLANTDERTRLSAQEHSVTKKLSNIIALDAETKQVYNGVNALTELLKGAKTFIAGLHIPEEHFYAGDKAAISVILSEPAFSPIIESKGKLQPATIAEFDVLLRFRHREDIQKLLRHIYFLDVYLSIARVAKEREFAFPQALPRGQHRVRLQGVYHPQVKNAVPNNITITPEGNVIFLTGANMAGKSTFMKSFSIAMFLAHMGFPVAAKEMEFSVLDGIYTTINLPDNLGMGASHFYAEVLRVKKMANELSLGKNLLIVFDELFRGTNVKDAYEATIAITKGFAGKRNSLFVISTHIIEAGGVLKQACPNVRFVYLPTRMNGRNPVYTYTLDDGITDDRHGMIIINNEGIMDILEAGIKKKTSA